MLIPYSTEVLIKKWPVSNLVIMGLCILFFLVLAVSASTGVSGPFMDSLIDAMVLDGWSPAGLLGYSFLHAGLVHLLGNMLCLWVFGNAVCEKVGNAVHAGVFILSGVLAGVVHNVMDGHPAIGASGAVNGMIGFYLVLYPVNRINCFYWFIRPGTFEISGYWLILFWFALDAWQAITGSQRGIAYWAHIGGFLSGLSFGFIALKTGLAQMAHYDNPTLLDYLRGGAAGPEPVHRNRTLPEIMKDKPARTPSRPAERIGNVPFNPRPDVNIDCPHCAQNLDVPGSMVGIEFACPACNGKIQLKTD